MGMSLAVGIRVKDSGMDMQGQGQASWPGAGSSSNSWGARKSTLELGCWGIFGHVVSERCAMSKLRVQYI